MLDVLQIDSIILYVWGEKREFGIFSNWISFLLCTTHMRKPCIICHMGDVGMYVCMYVSVYTYVCMYICMKHRLSIVAT